LKNHDHHAGYHNPENTDEFGYDEEIIKSGTRLRTDGVRHVHDNQDEDGEELPLKPSGLIGYACSRKDALYKDNA
jgi:hypothetical protein